MILTGLTRRWHKQWKPAASPTTDFSQQVTTGLVGYWVVNEVEGSTGKAWDIGLGSLPLSYPSSGITWRMGLYGGACPEFGGSTDIRATPGASSKLDFVRDIVSVACWFYPAGVASFNGICGLPTSADNDFKYGMRVSSAGKLNGGIGGTSITSTTTLTADTWYFGVVTYDGANVRLYLNGIEDATAVAKTGNLASSTSPFKVGNYVSTQFFVSGSRIDQVAVWERALQPTEILQLYYQPWIMLRPQAIWATRSSATPFETPQFPFTPMMHDMPHLGLYGVASYGSGSGIRTD